MKLKKIDDIVMRYIDKETQSFFEYEQIDDTFVFNKENKTIRVTMQNIDKEEKERFDVVIKKKNKSFFIKTDYFTDQEEYPLKIFKENEEFILFHDFGREIIYLHISY